MNYAASDLSVVICTYTFERLHFLQEGIASVRAQTQAPGEIIIVVDHNPELLAHVKTWLPGIKVVANIFQRGISGARNAGVDIGQGKLIAFLDDDAAASPTWLEQSLKALEDRNVLGVGGTIAPRWQCARPCWFPEEFDWVVGCTYRGLPSAQAPVRNLIAASMCVQREIFTSIGGFRDDLGRINQHPVGAEETEWCIRATAHFPGHYFLFDPAIVVHQHVPTKRATWNYFFARCYYEGCSKAILTQHTSTEIGLASERSYTLQTLPAGVVHALFDIRHGGASRAAAIMLGLAATSLGYVSGRARQMRMT